MGNIRTKEGGHQGDVGTSGNIHWDMGKVGIWGHRTTATTEDMGTGDVGTRANDHRRDVVTRGVTARW